MAQKKHDQAAKFGKSVKNCLPNEDGVNDTVSPEGMALVKERMAKALAGRTLRSVNDTGRVVQFG